MLHDIILFLTGIMVGSMNAIAGGGMLIGFPVMLAVGVPALVANVTTNIVILPGNISSAYAYRRYLRKVPRQYLLLIIPVIAGAITGASLLRHTSSGSFERLIPWLILFAVVLFAFQPFLHRHIHQHLQAPKSRRQSLGPLLFIGLAILPLAVYGGFFGAGFGFIMLAFLGFTKLHAHMHRMNALKNLMTVFIASTALICLFSTYLIDWHHGLVMAAGNLVGGYAGAVGAQKVSSHAIRIAVIIIGLGSAAYLGLSSS